MTPEKRIEQIWKENSKIPFMQSKDILALGFNKGMEYLNVSNTKNTKDGSFVGGTKEIIEYSNKVLNLSDLEKENIKLDIINEILDFITDKRDLMETYTKVKDMKTSIIKHIKNLQKSQKKNG